MKRDAIIIFISIIAIIFLAIFVLIENGSKGQLNSNVNLQGNSVKEDENKNLTNFSNSFNRNSDNLSAGAESLGKSDGAAGENSLPSDLYAANCGFYYDSYGVCAGICPSGRCVSEGRSCYCKS